MRNLGRRDPGPFPLLPKCPRCGHHIAAPGADPRNMSHWPWCPDAPADMRDRWKHRRELRALRTIGRRW